VSTVLHTAPTPGKLASGIKMWSLICKVQTVTLVRAVNILYDSIVFVDIHIIPINSLLPHFGFRFTVVHIAHNSGKLTFGVAEWCVMCQVQTVTWVRDVNGHHDSILFLDSVEFIYLHVYHTDRMCLPW